MVNPALLEILRCPVCVAKENATAQSGLLELVKDSWLVCGECGRKYPIIEDIPILLIDEGNKWMNTPAEKLPVPPPARD